MEAIQSNNISSTSQVVVKASAIGSSGATITSVTTNDGRLLAVEDNNGNNFFVGVSEGSGVFRRIVGTDYAELKELLTRAVNNRTRQRNYFRLYSQMLDKEISEDDFYKLIEENEDKYVVEEIENPSEDKLRHALELSRDILDVDNSEDLATLFSFNGDDTDRQLVKIEQDECL